MRCHAHPGDRLILSTHNIPPLPFLPMRLSVYCSGRIEMRRYYLGRVHIKPQNRSGVVISPWAQPQLTRIVLVLIILHSVEDSTLLHIVEALPWKAFFCGYWQS